MQATIFIFIFAAILLTSLLAAPRRARIDGFFGGLNGLGQVPDLWVLVLSQVTTWVFARS